MRHASNLEGVRTYEGTDEVQRRRSDALGGVGNQVVGAMMKRQI